MAPAGGAALAFIGNLGGGEILAILIVALVVLGPERLPQVARQIGRGMHKARVMARNLSSEMGDVLSDPAMEPFRELGELATRPKEKLLEYAREAELEERAAAERAALAGQEAIDEAANPADDHPGRDEPDTVASPDGNHLFADTEGIEWFDDPTESTFPSLEDVAPVSDDRDGDDERAVS